MIFESSSLTDKNFIFPAKVSYYFFVQIFVKYFPTFSCLTSVTLVKMPEGEARNPMQAFVDAVIDTVDAPVTWFRGLLFFLLNILYCVFSLNTKHSKAYKVDYVQQT